MALKEPASTEETVYFTRRKFGPNGTAVGWAYRIQCPKCKKGLMKKLKKTAQEYTCPECKYEEPKKEHEAKLEVQVKYTCPFCHKDGESTTEYTRKAFYGTKAFVFKCTHCNEKLGLTKKMKDSAKFDEKIMSAQ